MINRDGLSVWLDVPIERLVARVPADGRRPLAADRAEFERLYLHASSGVRAATCASTRPSPESIALSREILVSLDIL